MAYTFQSRATADLIMLAATAEQILKILDKPLGAAGILTVEQIPAAVEALEQAVAEDELRRKVIAQSLQANEDHESPQAAAAAAELGTVSLHQRVVPFVEMLRRSAEEGKPVTWKV